jgi:hypothetical protein
VVVVSVGGAVSVCGVVSVGTGAVVVSVAGDEDDGDADEKNDEKQDAAKHGDEFYDAAS